MWTIEIEGEADDLFVDCLTAIPSGYRVDIHHADFTGFVSFGSVVAGDIIVVECDPDSGEVIRPEKLHRLSLEGLDKIHIY